MPRGRCTAIKYLLDNLDVAGVAELATEFASPEGAIRSFGAFNARLRELVKTNAVPPEEETSWAQVRAVATVPSSIADQITDLIAALHDADADTLEAITGCLAMIDIVTRSQAALAARCLSQAWKVAHLRNSPKMHSMADSFAARGLYLNTPNWQGPVLVQYGPRKGMVADPGYCSDPRGPTRARPKPTFHELQPEPLELSDRDRGLWPASTISSA